MKKYLYFAVFVICLSSCSNQTKQAEALLENAKHYCESNEYANAKLLLDSLKKTYPHEVKIQKEGLQLMRNVELKEQERNLNYCDSILTHCIAKSEEMKKHYIFEKTEYDDIGKFFSKKQSPENNLQKSGIRASVNEVGEMYIASVYYGSSPINHSRLKVISPDGQYTETDDIPRDGGLNYSFQNLGMTTEIVTYKKGKDGGVIDFIINNQQSALKAVFEGKKPYTITISPADKQAVVEINELATVLSDIERLKKEIQKAQARIEYLKAKISTNE